MPVYVRGIPYLSVAELEAELSISRQTIWRWRKEGRIPAGRRFRDNKVLFTEAEAEAVRAYALRIEPIGANLDQLKLFNGFH
jgi:predicted DNA-binding transcriptional regulator AlpA